MKPLTVTLNEPSIWSGRARSPRPPVIAVPFVDTFALVSVKWSDEEEFTLAMAPRSRPWGSALVDAELHEAKVSGRMAANASAATPRRGSTHRDDMAAVLRAGFVL